MTEDCDAQIGSDFSPDTERGGDKYLTFWSDGQLFGTSISVVVQIVGVQAITEIPDYPAYAKGVINLRGAFIPVIDFRLLLGKPETEYTERTCIIVSNIRDQDFGLIVDGVDEVTGISEVQISPPPQMGADAKNRHMTGIARLEEKHKEKVVLLIGMERIFNEKEFGMPAQDGNGTGGQH